MAKKILQSLAVTVPQSCADFVFAHLPEDALSSTAFKCDGADFGSDPLWVVEALYDAKPDIVALSLELGILAASRGENAYRVAMGEVAGEGWLKANQQSFAPIVAGRVVIHGRARRAAAQAPYKGIAMDPSGAFGTGEHPTTYGCLMALQQMKVLRKNIKALDIGTGSAILALAMCKAIGVRQIVATDSDAETVQVAQDNIKKNGARRFIRCAKAIGFHHHTIARHRPYDLIVSNIFARPLMRLAPAMRKHLKRGGRVILAGFLNFQENAVIRAYAAQRIDLEKRMRVGVWTIVVLRKR